MPEKVTGTLIKRAAVRITFFVLSKDFFFAPFSAKAFHIPIGSSLDVYKFLWKYILEDRQPSHCARLVLRLVVITRA